MPDSLAEHAQRIRAEMGELWIRVNEATDAQQQLPDEDREALLRELAELARIPFDIAESATGGPNEPLSAAAINARRSLLHLSGLAPDRTPLVSRTSLASGAVKLSRL